MIFGDFLILKKKKKKEAKRKIIKGDIIRDNRTHFEQEKEKIYYEPKKVSNYLNNDCIEYERNGDKNRNLSIDEYLSKTELYLRNIIISLQNSDTWESQLTITINNISSKDSEKDRVMHSSSDNTKFISYNEVNDVIEKLFKSLHSKYKDVLKTSMKGSDFIYCKCHKVNFRRGGSYIDSPD